MDHLKRIAADEKNDWANFYEFCGITIADTLGDKALRILIGTYVIGVKVADRDIYDYAIVCADDRPVFRIRTFESFAAARRFMSSLVLRGVNAKMRVIRIADDNPLGVGVI